MSALGHKRTFVAQKGISALPQKRTFAVHQPMSSSGHCLVYSITSSARAINVLGKLRPSALAVLRLMVSSKLVGCTTGNSVGFAPLRILETYSPACHHAFGKACSVAHEPSGRDHLSKRVNCWNLIASGERNQLFTLTEEVWIDVDKQCPYFPLRSGIECGFDLSLAAGLKHLKATAQRLCCILQVFGVWTSVGIIGINQQSEQRIFRDYLAYQFEPFGAEHVHEIGYAGDIFGRSIETSRPDQLGPDLADNEDDRNWCWSPPWLPRHPVRSG